MTGTIMHGTLIMLLTGAGACALVVPLRRWSMRTGFVAMPNSRSSHQQPIPLGGGLSFVVPVTLAWLVNAVQQSDLALATMAVLGLFLSTIGYIDDLCTVRPTIRLCAQFLASGAMVWIVLRTPECEWSIGCLAFAVAAIFALTWHSNLFNFMDGINGIAAVEGAFVGVGGILVVTWSDSVSPLTPALAALVGGLIGFLPWNAPQARIFMGDAGSTWLGFVVAALALQDSIRAPGHLSAWLILPALFVTDTTVCGIRRLWRGERLTAGHRAHGYQNLARQLGSHGRVVAIFLTCNVCILGAAWLSLRHAHWAWAIVTAVYVAAVTAALIAKSGVHGVADPETRKAMEVE